MCIVVGGMRSFFVDCMILDCLSEVSFWCDAGGTLVAASFDGDMTAKALVEIPYDDIVASR